MLLFNACVGRRLFSSALAPGLLVYVYEVMANELALLRGRDVVAASGNLVSAAFYSSAFVGCVLLWRALVIRRRLCDLLGLGRCGFLIGFADGCLGVSSDEKT